MGARPPLSAAYFDAWYAQMARFPAKDEIQRRHLGLPVHVPSTGSLTGSGIGEVGAALRLPPGGTLLDLACGRGGYGLEIAARNGARLVGVDFSAEALRQAARLAEQLGRRSVFVVGELTATGLGAGAVDGVLCVDSIQFAEPQAAAYAEIRRVLGPGGRVVLTGWEPVEPGDPRLVSRLQDVDLHAGLHAAGFDEVTVHERPDWRATERQMWEEAAGSTPRATPRCSPCTTRRYASWTPSSWSAVSWRPQPRPDQAPGATRPERCPVFPAAAGGVPAPGPTPSGMMRG